MMGSIQSQEAYVCSERWPKKATDLAIETFSAEALFGNWEFQRNMGTGFDKLKLSLKREFGTTYSDTEVLEALELLHERFVVWKKLKADPQVLINPYTKQVSAQPHVWERLIKDDERVKWYGEKGELAYDDLEVIFENPFKGKSDFVFLGEVSGIHDRTMPLDQVPLPPLPVAQTPPRGRTYIDQQSPIRESPDPLTNLLLTPTPAGSPGDIRIISKGAYEKSVSAKKTKNTKKLFVVPDSPLSSVGSSSNPQSSSFEKIRSKFKRSG